MSDGQEYEKEEEGEKEKEKEKKALDLEVLARERIRIHAEMEALRRRDAEILSLMHSQDSEAERGLPKAIGTVPVPGINSTTLQGAAGNSETVNGSAIVEATTTLITPRESFINGARFLDEHDDDDDAGSLVRPLESEVVALASYPRSGNTLLRSLLERISGIVTGSDSDPQRSLIKHLIEMGMRGEGMVDSQKVWCVKTHFPERVGYCRFEAQRAILIVRNPFDAILSYFNMILTQSHTLSVEESEYSKFAEVWDELVRMETEIWKEFHSHWLGLNQQKFPLLVVRYEDLLQNREPTIEKIVLFLYKVSSPDQLDPRILARLKEACNSKEGLVSAYVPRAAKLVEEEEKEKGDLPSSSSAKQLSDGAKIWLPLDPSKPGFLKSIKYFSSEQRKYLVSSARSLLSYFGYFQYCRLSPNEEPYIFPRVGEMLKLNLPKRDKDGEEEDKGTIRFNVRFGIRPRTIDDPNGRGFAFRWRAKLSGIGPVRVSGGGVVSFPAPPSSS